MAFGDIVFVTTIDLPVYGKGSVLDRWCSMADAFVDAYRPDDYIICTGQPMAIFMIGYVMGRANLHIPPRFLVWRRQEGEYRVVSFPSIG